MEILQLDPACVKGGLIIHEASVKYQTTVTAIFKPNSCSNLVDSASYNSFFPGD